jgi:hypothetical protein
MIVTLINRGTETRNLTSVKLGDQQSTQSLADFLMLEQDVLSTFRIKVFDCKLPKVVSYRDQCGFKRDIDFIVNTAQGLPLQVLDYCDVEQRKLRAALSLR